MKPNILVLLTDQQRFDTIAAAGHHHMVTPNLDRLVNEGCNFTHAYSPHPICIPARHSLWSGMSSRVHGYHCNASPPWPDDGIPMLPQLLSDHGYFTAAVGKMHFIPPRRHHGFQELHLMEEIPQCRRDDAYATHLKDKGYEDIRCLHGVRPYLYHEPQSPLVPEHLHGSAFITDRSIDILESLDSQRPFFLVSSWIHPHPPLNVPKRWKSLYRDRELPGPVPISRDAPFFEGISPWFGDSDSEDIKRDFRETYFGSISFVDYHIGRLLDYLEEKNVLENTLIIFTSDHGEMLQDKGFYQKALPFEGASRIPFLIRYPKYFEPGSEDRRFVDLMDIFPTVIDIAGIDFHEKPSRSNYQLHGESLLVRNANTRDRSLQYTSCLSDSRRWVAIRDRRYKYVYFYNGGIEHFYDLESDPGEQFNLVKSSEVPFAQLEHLRKKALEFECRLGPREATKNGSYKKYAFSPWKSPRGSGKYPLWANQQFPQLKEVSNLKEGTLFLNDFKASLSKSKIEDIAPDRFFTENFLNAFQEWSSQPLSIQSLAKKEEARNEDKQKLS
ncbi:MAG: sulfatase-like hydrolase/transferase [Verrucomicrobiota bacterium]